MKRYFLLLLLFITIPLAAQQRERILRFHSDIVINTDGRVEVTETIRVNALGIDIRRGIIRSIPIYRKDKDGVKKKVDFTVLSLKRNGVDEEYETKKEGNLREIYIGNEDFLDEGIHEYTITYESYGHVGFFDDFDELYWNVTGNDWIFPIDEASASVYLPRDASPGQTACYTGISGSRAQDCSYQVSGNRVDFQSNYGLRDNEGFTIAVSFPRDIVKRPPPPSEAQQFWNKFKTHICSVIGLLILACFYFFTWKRVGKDPEKRTVVPAFKPPHDWSPATVRYLYKRVYDNKAFSVTLINMAVKGLISIRQENKKKFKLESKEMTAAATAKEKDMYDTLFQKGSKLELSDKNYKTISKADTRLRKSLESSWNLKDFHLRNTSYIVKGIFLALAILIGYTLLTNTGRSVYALLVTLPFIVIGIVMMLSVKENKGCSKVVVFVFGFAFAVPTLIIQFGLLLEEDLLTALFISLVSIACALYVYLIGAPTELGAKTKAELEGFRMYLKTAEENRLNLLTPPERTPELFEKLLPYAIALDVENEWGKKFDQILQNASYNPDWYDGPEAFQSTLLIHSLNRTFNSSLEKSKVDPTVSSSSRSSGGSWSSGSSGGGFSGGGGGGGGGRGR